MFAYSQAASLSQELHYCS